MQIAFVGLGRMGWHIAGHLSRHRHRLTVFDANQDLSNKWVDCFEGEVAQVLPDAVKQAAVVVTALPADAHLQTVWDNCFEALQPGTVWIDHSTTSAQIARALGAQGHSKGIAFVDAPVSGGTIGAQNGTLAIMAGSSTSAWSTIETLLHCYASKATRIGETGSGQLTKMANQICVAGVGQALAEGLSFAEREGLDVQKVLAVMLKGSSTSWMMENRSEAMLQGQYEFGFSSTLMKKDLGLVLDEAQRLGMPLPVTAQVADLLNELADTIDPAGDWCSLMESQRQKTTKSD